LAGQLSLLLGVPKTEAIRQALEEKKHRLSFQFIRINRQAELKHLLKQEIWPSIPSEQLGKRLTHKEEDEILGYGG